MNATGRNGCRRWASRICLLITVQSGMEMGSLSSMCHDYLYDHSVQETYEHKRQDHLREMQGKEEQMRQMFVQKVYLPH